MSPPRRGNLIPGLLEHPGLYCCSRNPLLSRPRSFLGCRWLVRPLGSPASPAGRGLHSPSFGLLLLRLGRVLSRRLGCLHLLFQLEVTFRAPLSDHVVACVILEHVLG
ncbi:MAG: hypothetical protein ACK559_34385, partial [bacterium]